MQTVFFDCSGVVYDEFMPQGCTVNKKYNLEVMCRLCEAIRQKGTELWTNQLWILHHDNTPNHISMLVPEFLARNKIVIMPQPPDLIHADFLLFAKLKIPMTGKPFATIEEIKEKSKRDWNWKIRWHRCNISAGADFEGDNIVIDI